MDVRFFRQRRALLKAGMAACGVVAVGGIAKGLREARGPGEYRFIGDAMGTTYAVTFVAPVGERSLHGAVRAAVDAAIGDVDARMSTFAYASELSRLNRHAGPGPLALSEDTLRVLTVAHGISEASGGAFDVTAGPLVNAWGFGPACDPRVPGKAELAGLRERVGFRGLQIDDAARSVRKMHPAMYVDLSGIAKGYGVDRAARVLDALGITAYAIELGGEVRTRGSNLNGHAWRVAIEEPQPALPRKVRRVVPLAGLAMATSGDYRIYFERDGHRYCHEIDPVSASPVAHALTSVTVIAADCASADAYATALMVLGPEKGYALAERLDLGAYFIERAPGGTLIDRATPAFTALG